MNPVNPLDIGIAVSVASPVNARDAYTDIIFSLNDSYETLDVGVEISATPLRWIVLMSMDSTFSILW